MCFLNYCDLSLRGAISSVVSITRINLYTLYGFDCVYCGTNIILVMQRDQNSEEAGPPECDTFH